jgi:hypothetical protein
MAKLDASRCVPFLLEVPITAQSSGNAAAPGSLINPAGGPVLVDELRFCAIQTLRMNTRATIQIGRYTVADDVPLSVLCKPIDRGTDGATIASWANLMVNTATTAKRYRMVPQDYVWRLARPIILPKGARVSISLRNKALLTPPYAYVPSGFVSVVGRTLPDDAPIPDAVDVPYAAHWTISGSMSEGLTSASTAADLRNRFDTALRVHRFTADLAFVDTGSQFTEETFDDYGWSLGAKIRIYGQNGVLGVRDFTPLGALFNYARRSWTVNSVLAARGYYIAEIVYPSNPVAPQTATDLAFSVAMIGTHTEPLSSLGEEVQ